jgi:nickel-dependent lactate racemase
MTRIPAGPSSTTSPGGPGPSLRWGLSGPTGSANSLADWTDTTVEVRINRHVAEADVAIVIGPLFPHEVVGFFGGNKCFFPGVSGPELINLSHWVGALITSAEMIGTRGVTPVRALVNEAASLIPARRLGLCSVVASGTETLHAAAFGTWRMRWQPVRKSQRKPTSRGTISCPHGRAQRLS